MRNTSRAAVAALSICLVASQSVSAFAEADVINSHDDARSFAIREAEIAREKALAARGQQQAPVAEAEARKDKASNPVTRSAKVSSRAARALAAPAGSEGLKSVVARHAAANGVPFALADAVVRIESRYNPRASNAGNYGLMQIRHQTARGMGYNGSASGLLDAETNARFGMKYLAHAYRLAGGDTCRTVMKYQSGHRAERMNGANRSYCAKVRTISAHN
jgi:soluble lytic murein transglycosylase-like protein